MTTKAPKNYSKGKIYKIEPICEHEEGDIYIGLTTKDYLSQRMVKHKGDYNRWKKSNTKFITCFKIFDKYSVENCQIILLESVVAKDFNELKARETYHIQTLKCINKLMAKLTEEQYNNKIEKMKEIHKVYYEANKESISEKQKIYYKENQDAVLNSHKEYKQNNKDKIKEYETLKFTCECGSLCVRKQRERHYRTEKHQLYLKSLQT